VTRYTSGANQEYRIKKLLEGAGAIVTRSAGSRGLADLVAMFDHTTFGLQIKSAEAMPTEAEHEMVREASSRTQAKWAMVHSRGRKIRVWVYQRGKPSKLPVPGLS